MLERWDFDQNDAQDLIFQNNSTFGFGESETKP